MGVITVWIDFNATGLDKVTREGRGRSKDGAVGTFNTERMGR